MQQIVRLAVVKVYKIIDKTGHNGPITQYVNDKVHVGAGCRRLLNFLRVESTCICVNTYGRAAGAFYRPTVTSVVPRELPLFYPLVSSSPAIWSTIRDI